MIPYEDNVIRATKSDRGTPPEEIIKVSFVFVLSFSMPSS